VKILSAVKLLPDTEIEEPGGPEIGLTEIKPVRALAGSEKVNTATREIKVANITLIGL
jgi:hypothetical protein